MDRRLAVTILAMVLVTAGAATLAVREREKQTMPLNEGVSGVTIDEGSSSEEASESSAEAEYTYLLREYEGRVAVFPYGEEGEPEMVLDTLVKYLPDYDRSQMQEGIPVKDYRELVALIEDFIS